MSLSLHAGHVFIVIALVIVSTILLAELTAIHQTLNAVSVAVDEGDQEGHHLARELARLLEDEKKQREVLNRVEIDEQKLSDVLRELIQIERENISGGSNAKLKDLDARVHETAGQVKGKENSEGNTYTDSTYPTPSGDDTPTSITNSPQHTQAKAVHADAKALRIRDLVPSATLESGHARPVFYLIFSPESSGNRFIASLLMAAGCYGTDLTATTQHHQPFDLDNAARTPNGFSHVKKDKLKNWAEENLKRIEAGDFKKRLCVVMHRSVPHGKQMVDLGALLTEIAECGFEPRVVSSVRGLPWVVPSQVKAHHVESPEQAIRQTQEAYEHIVREISRIEGLWFRIVPYASFGDDAFVQWFYHDLGFGVPAKHPVFKKDHH